MKNAMIAISVLLLFGAILSGCTSSGSNYAAYSQPGQQPQGQGGQYVGGGCGVAPSANYEDTNVKVFGNTNSGL